MPAGHLRCLCASNVLLRCRNCPARMYPHPTGLRSGDSMEWNLTEAVNYYRKQGAPGDQSAVIALLREMQQENGGAIPRGLLSQAAEGLGVKEGLLLALVKRLPSLRLSDTHILELCAGPNCPKRADLAGFVEKTYGKTGKFTVKTVPCMRMCGKGPNIKWDGVLYHQADEALIRKLVEER